MALVSEFFLKRFQDWCIRLYGYCPHYPSYGYAGIALAIMDRSSAERTGLL